MKPNKKTAEAKLGDKNPAAKLNQDNVLEIKKLIWIEGIHTSKIAKMYNVAARTIRDIKNQICWAHIRIPEEGHIEFLCKNPNIKLDEKKVKEIKKLLWVDGEHISDIAKKFNIGDRAIEDIRLEKTWKQVPAPEGCDKNMRAAVRNSKLTSTQVEEIRGILCNPGNDLSNKEIGELYNVSGATIGNIATGKRKQMYN